MFLRDTNVVSELRRPRPYADPGAQSASGTPQSLVLAPRFPPAAYWWTRTVVGSIMTYLLSASSGRTWKIRSNNPDLPQRVNPWWTLLQLQYWAGRSFQCALLRSTDRTPFTKRRLCLAAMPT